MCHLSLITFNYSTLHLVKKLLFEQVRNLYRKIVKKKLNYCVVCSHKLYPIAQYIMYLLYVLGFY